MSLVAYAFTRWIICVCLFFVSFIPFAYAQTADAFYNYVADLHLYESHQARSPKNVIRHPDGEKGRLLKSVLDPQRVEGVLTTYFQEIKRGEKLPELPKLFLPILQRYDTAFKQEPFAYESEYLDILDATVSVTVLGSSRMPKIAEPSLPENNLRGNVDGEKKALANSLQTLIDSLARLQAAGNLGLANEIRSRVAKGMFTAAGDRRALAIANRLAPPQ